MNFKEFKGLFDIFCMAFALFVPFFETFCVLLNTWTLAFMNPPTYSIMVYVNNYGEAYPELIMWIILFPICVYGIYLNFRYLAKELYLYRFRIRKIL